MDQPVKIHSHNIGKISTVLTILCSIHCIATPILALFIPFMDTHQLDKLMGTHQSDWVELALIAFIILLGGSSIYHGVKSHHHKRLPAIFFVTGLLFLIIGYFLHAEELQRLHTIMMVTGSTLSAIGQIYNLKLSHFSHK